MNIRRKGRRECAELLQRLALVERGVLKGVELALQQCVQWRGRHLEPAWVRNDEPLQQGTPGFDDEEAQRSAAVHGLADLLDLQLPGVTALA